MGNRAETKKEKQMDAVIDSRIKAIRKRKRKEKEIALFRVALALKASIRKPKTRKAWRKYKRTKRVWGMPKMKFRLPKISALSETQLFAATLLTGYIMLALVIGGVIGTRSLFSIQSYRATNSIRNAKGEAIESQEFEDAKRRAMVELYIEQSETEDRDPELWEYLSNIEKGELPKEKEISVHYDFTEKETYELAKLAMAEAGGADLKFKCLVLKVCLNQVESQEFGTNIHDVIYYNNNYEVVKNGMYYRANPSPECYLAVQMVKEGWDESQGAMFFRTTTRLGNWHDRNLHKLFEYGNGSFYRWPDGHEKAID